MSGYYVDISQFQYGIDWQKYKAWASQWDGISRVALRSSYGVGYEDAHYKEHRIGAEQAGIDVILHYHYAYPQLNSAEQESTWQAKVIGSIREQDLIMLDLEESSNTAQWALDWLQKQEAAYKRLPYIYANHAYVWNNLQDIRLARYPLILAHWHTKDIPACPLPYARFSALQRADDAKNIPGMLPGAIDLNVWL